MVLEAVRDITYPLGFGTFDRFVNPPRAAIAESRRKPAEITRPRRRRADPEDGRDYKPTKEPLLETTTRGVQGLLVVSRYLLIGPDGKVLKVDKMHWGEDGHFSIELTERLPAGRYTVVLGILWTATLSIRQPASCIFASTRRELLARNGAGSSANSILQAGADGATMDTLIIQTLNSIFYAAVLFLIAAGLSLIYGVMRIVNLAHGTFYALGAYRVGLGGRRDVRRLKRRWQLGPGRAAAAPADRRARQSRRWAR